MPVLGLLTGYALNALSPRRSLSIGLTVVLLISGITLNMQHIVNPDYGHSSKALCQRLNRTGLTADVFGTFQLYDPDLTWYCDRNMMTWTLDPVFRHAVGDIPMMRPFVRTLDAAQRQYLTKSDAILVTTKRSVPEMPDACSILIKPRLRNEMTGSDLVLAGLSKKACIKLHNVVFSKWRQK